MRERDQQNNKQSALHQLTSHISQFLMELPGGVTLETVPAVNIEVKSGQTLASALSPIHDKITATKQHLTAVRTAPLPKDDQRKLAAEYVGGLMRAAAPSVSVVPDKLKVTVARRCCYQPFGPDDDAGLGQRSKCIGSRSLFVAAPLEQVRSTMERRPCGPVSRS